MKVCLLNDSFPPLIDGVANVVLNYAGIMTREGFAEVEVGTPRYPDADYSSYPYTVVPYQSLNTSRIAKGYRAGNLLDLPEVKRLGDFGPDIIHTHCPMASTYLARMLRVRTGAPVVFTYHTKFDEDIARAVRQEFLQKESIKLLVKNIEACDEVWVVSEGAGQNLRSLGFSGDYRVVTNGVDFPRGRVSEDRVREATAGYDLPAGIPVYLFVGRMIHYKGVPVILDALKKLDEQGLDFRMVLIGSGCDLDSFKDQARTLGLYDDSGETPKGKCIFTGAIYDREVLRAWNTRADLFLFPSTYDTNGIVVREAAACGLGSVLIENSCAAEGITSGRNGFTIAKDADSMAALLMREGQDIARMQEIGQHAMDEIYISWEESVRQAYERYGVLLEQKARGELAVRSPLGVSAVPENLLSYYLSMRERVKRGRDAVTSIPEEFAERYGMLKEGISDRYGQMKEDISDRMATMKDGIAGRYDQVKDGITDRVATMKEKILK